jgi:hypothetical protein
MGGNVFPGKNRRYSAQEYHDLCVDITTRLDHISYKWSIAPSAPSKESFGDMDVIIVPNDWNIDLLKSVFETEYVKHNGPTWSLIFKDFQIDLITTPIEEFDFCLRYHGYFDVGNFRGKIAHQLGLQYGHDGMWLHVRLSDSHSLGKIRLTLDPFQAERFIDIEPVMDYKNIEEVFENISKSKYFNPATFKLENNNAVARIRDKKRPSYHAFLAWMDKLPPRDYFVKSSDKNEYLPMIFVEFPDAKPEYDALFEKKLKLDQVSEKFNGDLVREWLPEISNKNLGYLIREYKSLYSSDDMFEMTQDEIKEDIVALYELNSKYHLDWCNNQLI